MFFKTKRINHLTKGFMIAVQRQIALSKVYDNNKDIIKHSDIHIGNLFSYNEN